MYEFLPPKQKRALKSRKASPWADHHKDGNRGSLLILIKPSHYDDEGYVICWWRAMILNSLAAVYGIAADCAERQVLGREVDLERDAIDETNTRVDIPPARLPASEPAAGSAWSDLSAFSLTSIRALLTLPPILRAGVPATWAASTFRVASRCWTAVRSSWMMPASWEFRCLPERPKAGLNCPARRGGREG